MLDYQKILEYQHLFDKFHTINAAIYSFNLASKKVFVTHGVEEIFGCPKDAFDRKYWKKMIHPEDKDKVLRWEKQLSSGKEPTYIQYRIVRGENEVRWVEDHLSPVENLFGEPEELLGLLIDITDKKVAEQQIEYMAYHDSLTGLPNRNMFNEYSRKALARCKRKGLYLALLFLDLDNFKLINDNFGHTFGDQVLAQLAERLNQCVRDGDIVARVGGDEFIILLEDTDREKTEQIVLRILSNLAVPYKVEDQRLMITASVGISLFPDHGSDIETLKKNADEAMYCSKNRGCNLYSFYND